MPSLAYKHFHSTEVDSDYSLAEDTDFHSWSGTVIGPAGVSSIQLDRLILLIEFIV